MSEPYNTIVAAPKGAVIVVPKAEFSKWHDMAWALRKGAVRVMTRDRMRPDFKSKTPIHYIYADEETA